MNRRSFFMAALAAIAAGPKALARMARRKPKYQIGIDCAVSTSTSATCVIQWKDGRGGVLDVARLRRMEVDHEWADSLEYYYWGPMDVRTP